MTIIRFIRLIILLLFFVLTRLTLGQSTEIQSFQFHGSNKIFGQFADRRGTNQEIPKELWREDLSLTLTVYGIPISATGFITPEQSKFRQSIDNFRIYVNTGELRRNMQRFKLPEVPDYKPGINLPKGVEVPKVDRPKLEIPRPEGFWDKTAYFLSGFSTLEFGRCRPDYSDYTLIGIPVSGVNIEYNPGLPYAAISIGNVKRAVEASEDTGPVFREKLLFGKFGVGTNSGSHFHVTLMRVKDDEKSLSSREDTDSFSVFPRSNHVVGTNGKISFFKEKLTLEGEAAVSLITRDTGSPGAVEEDVQVPGWLVGILEPNSSSSADYAYYAKTSLNLPNTTISGGIKTVAPGFITLGNPNLISDKMTYDARIDQSFAGRKITFSTYAKQSRDNLVDWKESTTNTTALGVIAGFRFINIPYLQFSYTPSFQKTDSDSMNLDNTVNVINAATGYNYTMGKLRGNSNFNYFHQNTETILDTIKNLSTTNTFTFNQTFSFPIPLDLNGGISYSQSEFSENKQDIIIYLFSGTYNAFARKWRNTMGWRYTNRVDEQQKNEIYWYSRLKLWNLTELDVRVEKNMFEDLVESENDYDEWVGKVTLLVKW